MALHQVSIHENPISLVDLWDCIAGLLVVPSPGYEPAFQAFAIACAECLFFAVILVLFVLRIFVSNRYT